MRPVSRKQQLFRKLEDYLHWFDQHPKSDGVVIEGIPKLKGQCFVSDKVIQANKDVEMLAISIVGDIVIDAVKNTPYEGDIEIPRVTTIEFSLGSGST